MQETWQETPAAIPAPVDRECSEVVETGFEAMRRLGLPDLDLSCRQGQDKVRR